MGLGHSGTEERWDWYEMGLRHSGTGNNGAGIQLDWETVGHNGTGIQRDWAQRDRTSGTQYDWHSV